MLLSSLELVNSCFYLNCTVILFLLSNVLISSLLFNRLWCWQVWHWRGLWAFRYRKWGCTYCLCAITYYWFCRLMIIWIWYRGCKYRCTSWLRQLNPSVAARSLVNLVLSREDPLWLPLHRTLMATCLSLSTGARHLSLFAKLCFVLVTLIVLSSSMRRYFLCLDNCRLFQKLEMLEYFFCNFSRIVVSYVILWCSSLCRPLGWSC